MTHLISAPQLARDIEQVVVLDVRWVLTAGRSADDVTPVTTEEYFAGKDLAPRPLRSVMDLTKLRATGFEPEDAMSALAKYLADTEG